MPAKVKKESDQTLDVIVNQEPQLISEKEGINQIDVLNKENTKLARHISQLKKRLGKVQEEYRRLKKRCEMMRRELDQIKAGSNPIGSVDKIFEENDERKAIIRLSTGQMYVARINSLDLKEGDSVVLSRRELGVIGKIPSFIDRKIEEMGLLEIPSETYENIGGLDEQIQEVREVMELSLKYPDLFEEFNIKSPRGILLYGPPGTGKTLIAKAVANAANAKFLYMAAPELVQKYIGEGARMVREIFKLARSQEGPVIIFIDEIDAIASKRNAGNISGEREVNRTLMQLLTEMDGFKENKNIKIIAATNRLDILDDAILRPGRFDRIIELPMPDLEARKQIFKIHLRGKPTFRINLDELALKSEGFSGADIRAVCVEAAMMAIRMRLDGKRRKTISQKMILDAIEKIRRKREQAFKMGLKEPSGFYS